MEFQKVDFVQISRLILLHILVHLAGAFGAGSQYAMQLSSRLGPTGIDDF